MKTSQLLLLPVLILSMCTSPSMNERKEPPRNLTEAFNVSDVGFDPVRLARIDSLCEHAVQKNILPNFVTFVARHGQIVHYKAYGYRNQEKNIPAQKDDIFRLASMSKAIVTVALMTLYEEGKFLLDDPLAKYIPAFSNMKVMENFDPVKGTYTTRPAKGQITIWHLLTHTSGIHYGDLSGNKLYEKAGIPVLHCKDSLTIAQVVERLAAQPLMHDPGAGWTYGLNTDVVGRLVEIFSGKPLDVALKERIFDPLGMKDTWFYLPEKDYPRLVTLYGKEHPDSLLKLSENDLFQTYAVSGAKTYFSGGAGLVGTIEDYARFCQMLLNKGTFNGKHILSRKTIDIMTMNQIGDFGVWGGENKFGLGFEIMTENFNRHILGSVGSFKWGGMYYTDYLIDPQEDMIFLFFTNVYPYAGPDLHQYFRIMVYQALTD
ncbi:MAG: serine hydrolase domain-containing protein [Bacteroidales bacterium]